MASEAAFQPFLFHNPNMQFYIAIQGEKRGPFSLHRLTDMLRDREVSPECLGWHQDMERWLPLKEIPALTEIIRGVEKDSEKKAEEAEAGENKKDESGHEEAPVFNAPRPKTKPKPPAGVVAIEVKPFRRLWARFADQLIFSILAWWIFDLPPLRELSEAGTMTPELWKVNMVMLGAALVSNVVEALLIGFYGTTPGKWLLGIRVVRNSDGRNPDLRRSFLRAFFVWVAGLGMGPPILALPCMSYSFFRLLAKGDTLWDKSLGTNQEYENLNAPRILAILAAFLLLSLAFTAVLAP